MNILDEIKKRFSGFKNSLFLLLALIISLRFAGADAESQPLKGRLEYALGLILGIAILGIILGFARIIIRKINRKNEFQTIAPGIDFVSGFKYGVVAGTVILFLVGVLMVKDFLKPVEDIAKGIGLLK